ncbi:YkgJ family cysteine cluster protein [Desulfovibrio oxyclinae]|jgi:hypothetical protein|uniref:YkgJ family cysteine cluster protein n=1 Tax=Desulfovibrio oxyclinae TaxID=63560 RepID=UPI000364D07D|nr:YkgJ family cysteine cluster protein [Desulfovibrio oxyclinae]
MSVAAFDCKMCGHCCHGEGGIVMSEKDRVRLAEHLEQEVDSMLEQYAYQRGGKWQVVTGDDGYCVFFREGAGCSVHPGRPDICRAWPFFRGNLIDEGSWEMIQEYCPGVNPEAGHDEFVRQGKEYIRQEGLSRHDPDCDANALISEE